MTGISGNNQGRGTRSSENNEGRTAHALLKIMSQPVIGSSH